MRSDRYKLEVENRSDRKRGRHNGVKLAILVMLILLIALCSLLIVYFLNRGHEGRSKGWELKYNKIYYYDDQGQMQKGFKEINGETYYFEESGSEAGAMARNGVKLISGEPYYFDFLGRAAEEGWVKNRYYSEGQGKLKVGWAAIDKKAYYFYTTEDNGALAEKAKNFTAPNGIRIPQSGCLDGEEGRAYADSIIVLNSIGWDLRAAFAYVGDFGYSGRYERYEYLVHKCAIEGLEKETGNCLVWAGSFCALAKMLGYDCETIWGTIQWDGKTLPHSWTEIKENGVTYVYDPRKAQGEDFSGFRVKYGQKGTYNYNVKNKTYLKW